MQPRKSVRYRRDTKDMSVNWAITPNKQQRHFDINPAERWRTPVEATPSLQHHHLHHLAPLIGADAVEIDS